MQSVSWFCGREKKFDISKIILLLIPLVCLRTDTCQWLSIFDTWNINFVKKKSEHCKPTLHIHGISMRRYSCNLTLNDQDCMYHQHEWLSGEYLAKQVREREAWCDRIVEWKYFIREVHSKFFHLFIYDPSCEIHIFFSTDAAVCAIIK